MKVFHPRSQNAGPLSFNANLALFYLHYVSLTVLYFVQFKNLILLPFYLATTVHVAEIESKQNKCVKTKILFVVIPEPAKHQHQTAAKEKRTKEVEPPLAYCLGVY